MVATDIDVRSDVPDPEDPVFALHRNGKMSIAASVPIRDAHDLSLAYTPGVARVCEAIAADPETAHDYTWVSNTVAVVTDGTAVLGLGDIGPAASMPVMEGKAILFKQFGGVDAIPIALDTTDVDEIVETVVRLAPSFGGINLEDISSPRCFEIERRLVERLDIPVFHDDQHGTAVVTLAALINSARLTDRDLEDLKVVISGAGAAGVAIMKILQSAGVRKIAVVDRAGVIHPGRDDLNEVKGWLAEQTAGWARPGSIADALDGADVFVGVSGGTVPEEAVARMAPDAIVFAMANPHPEVHPDVAHRYARVVATGRSDFPNQINNVLVFPGIFRGALDVRATRISEGMKIAAATAIADLVGDDLSETYVIPSPFDPRVATAVSRAVTDTARREGLARRPY
ncbi:MULTISPECIES: NADP-dependent malic enzyme [Aeromicrobium]|uniref:NAD(P)-dependent malic enzyme n=1 Tax=Aeromicrobium TaxID=2040 RepID=UPI0006FACBAB|nr:MULTISPECIES: NADP-dependent malic enzyme [Aeromicrobium]KQX75137.1 malate dehydrogenase [Aeromicrobium sp. Root472D3]MBD8605596.1 NADP-dependent malic enzyme [Aeromicrobium sp. CFBP 8757]MCL8252762.1 NADP-dependent malic enzyme [Aeromicrobium fastidiosum]